MIRTATFLLFLAVAVSACDSALPDNPDPTLVVEGFIDTGRPLPAIRLSQTQSLKQRYDADAAAVAEADVAVQIGGREVRYAAVEPGLFGPLQSETAPAAPGETFSLTVDWNGARASAAGTVPPPIRMMSAHVVVPDEPVSAVLLDSLLLSDSLAVGAHKGYIYPIEVSLTWERVDVTYDEFWVRAQLQPFSDFSSTVVDLFLRSEAIFLEESAGLSESGARMWTGVYAIGVDESDDPVPEHELRISVIRSGSAYARFAASRGTPERREPVSNLDGAIGIFTAISVDSTRVQVGPAD